MGNNPETQKEIEEQVYDSPPSPIIRRNAKRRRLLEPISIPTHPKSAYELCQDQSVKERRAMAKQLFESDAVFPDVNTMNPSSYLQKLATMYDSDSD